jgi:hypothetical protein
MFTRLFHVLLLTLVSTCIYPNAQISRYSVVTSQRSEDALKRMTRAVDAYRAFYVEALVLPK